MEILIWSILYDQVQLLSSHSSFRVVRPLGLQACWTSPTAIWGDAGADCHCGGGHCGDDYKVNSWSFLGDRSLGVSELVLGDRSPVIAFVTCQVFVIKSICYTNYIIVFVPLTIIIKIGVHWMIVASSNCMLCIILPCPVQTEWHCLSWGAQNELVITILMMMILI